LKIQNGRLLRNPTEKGTLGCERTLSEASWFSIVEHLPHIFLRFSIHIPAVAVSKETHTWPRYSLSCFLLWRRMWHVSYYDYCCSDTGPATVRGPMQDLGVGPLWAVILWRHRVQSTVLRWW